MEPAESARKNESLLYVQQLLEKRGYTVMDGRYLYGSLQDSKKVKLCPGLTVLFVHRFFAEIVYIDDTTIGVDTYNTDKPKPRIPIEISLYHPDSFEDLNFHVDNLWRCYRKKTGLGLMFYFDVVGHKIFGNTLFGKIFKRVWIYVVIINAVIQICNLVASELAK